MRKLSVVLMVLLLLVMSSVVSAQDIPCGDLSADDCTLFSGAFASIGSADSATFTIDANIATTGGASDSTVAISGDGSFSGAQGLMGGMMSNMMSDPTAAANPAAMMEGLTSMLSDFSATLNLNVDSGTGAPLDIQLVLVDSIGYVNFGALGLAGMQLGQNTTLPEWGGVNLPELISTLGPSLAGMVPGMTPGGTTPSTDATPSSMDPAAMMQYLSITRIDDDTMDDGTAVATFEVTIDFAGMLSDPTVTADMTDAQMQQAQAMADSTDFTADIYVGIDDGMFYGIDLSGSVDASAIAAASSSTTTTAAAGTTDFDFALYFADFDNAPAVTAPDGAEVATTQQLMTLFGAMMGGPASR